MPEIMADVWLCCPAALCPSLMSVRMILEVIPALNVRMSIRLAGPHLDTINSHDHAATRPTRVSAAARNHRERPAPCGVGHSDVCLVSSRTSVVGINYRTPATAHGVLLSAAASALPCRPFWSDTTSAVTPFAPRVYATKTPPWLSPTFGIGMRALMACVLVSSTTMSCEVLHVAHIS